MRRALLSMVLYSAFYRASQPAYSELYIFFPVHYPFCDAQSMSRRASKHHFTVTFEASLYVDE